VDTNGVQPGDQETALSANEALIRSIDNRNLQGADANATSSVGSFEGDEYEHEGIVSVRTRSSNSGHPS
jgi:hypothetical protein